MTLFTILFFPVINSAQTPNLGTAINFVLFSSNGAVTNTGTTHLTGNVGTNKGSSTGFGNVDGVMHDDDAASAKCGADLLKVYNKLDSTTSTASHSVNLGNGDTLKQGVYALSGASTLNLSLYLDGGGDGNALFIFKIKGAFSSKAAAKIKLINGTKACNVFWKIEGAVNLATGTTMRGTIIANNAAIKMATGDTLEGRALSTTGAVTVDGILAYTPLGCSVPVLTGPKLPVLGTTVCYALFSSNGAVTNTGTTYVTGDIGTNKGLTTGYDTSKVNGTVHTIPDASTNACATDLTKVYNYLDSLNYDIQLLYPAKFGNNLVLTPHVYLLNAATVLTDSLYLNAEGNSDAVFVIQINGAFSTSTYSRVILQNGAQSKNVFWKIEGAVSIDNYSIFRGTLVCNNGALGALNTGVTIDGRALTTTGALKTNTVNATITSGCSSVVTGIAAETAGTNEMISIYPNPFNESTTIQMNDATDANRYDFKIYNIMGVEILHTSITRESTTINTNNFPSGIYLYRMINSNGTMQSGRLIKR